MREEAIYYDADATGNYEIYVADQLGGNVIQLTDDPEYDSWWPKLHPTDDLILFCRTPAGEHDSPTGYSHMELWTMKTDGSNLTKVMPQPSEFDGTWVTYGHPEWSPDGTQVCIFTRTSGGYAIVVLDAETWSIPSGGLRRAVALPNVIIDPSWSPDGSKLVFAENLSGVKIISAVDASGELNAGYTPIAAPSGNMAYDPYYSPDGEWIAFLLDRSGGLTWDIKITPSNANNVGDIIADGHLNSKPHWFDNEWIYFHRINLFEDDKMALYRIRKDGTGLERIQPAGQYGEYPTIRKIELPHSDLDPSLHVNDLIAAQIGGADVEVEFWQRKGYPSPPYGDMRQKALEVARGRELTGLTAGDREWEFWKNDEPEEE